MSITVALGFAGAQASGFLQTAILFADRFEIQQTRQPSIIGLPNQNAQNRGTTAHGTGVPKNIVIDFGMMEETLLIDGKIADEGDSQFNIGNLKDFISNFRTYWVNSPTVVQLKGNPGTLSAVPTQKGLIRVAVGSDTPNFAMIWSGCAVKCNFWREAAETYWNYKIAISVAFYPEQDQGVGFQS